MTVTLETASWRTVHESPWTETDDHLSFNMAAALRNVAGMVDEFPEVAALLERMFGNLINPVSATRNPVEALAALVHAASAHGGSVSKAEYGGVNIDFGPVFRMLVLTEAPRDPEPVVVEAAPEPPADVAVVAHDEVPDVAETPAEPVADGPVVEPETNDALAETATFDVEDEATAS